MQPVLIPCDCCSARVAFALLDSAAHLLCNRKCRGLFCTRTSGIHRMTELRQALDDINAIRSQVARGTQFRGYGPVSDRLERDPRPGGRRGSVSLGAKFGTRSARIFGRLDINSGDRRGSGSIRNRLSGAASSFRARSGNDSGGGGTVFTLRCRRIAPDRGFDARCAARRVDVAGPVGRAFQFGDIRIVPFPTAANVRCWGLVPGGRARFFVDCRRPPCAAALGHGNIVRRRAIARRRCFTFWIRGHH